MKQVDRREFMKVLGASVAAAPLYANIARALTVAANNRTGTIQDVEHIVVLMQENRPFDHHFGTMRGVRGYSDPRAIQINLPRTSGGATRAPVFWQPIDPSSSAAPFALPASAMTPGGPGDAWPVIPPFRIDPNAVSVGLTTLGGTWLPGTEHGWASGHASWNHGQCDRFAATVGPMAMSYMTRADLPYHYALADAFTVGDAYHCSIMGPTNPNRTYMWSGCIGNLPDLGPGGTDGKGAGPMTDNGLSPNGAYWTFSTFPEVLTKAGISWKFYQDLAGATFSPDFGGNSPTTFAGNYTDNPVLYFDQYATAPTDSPLYQGACTGTSISQNMPLKIAPASDWKKWALGLFAQFRRDVQAGTLPQVSYLVAPCGYTEHSDAPLNYGAWYISQVLDILVSRPEVFSKTVFIINYDEADGSFDHLPPPVAPASAAHGASTAEHQNEIVTTSSPNGPIGLGSRVPFLVISPWSKGGYVNSQTFDHTSVIQFIETRFGVHSPNISPWRRAVCGDLTSTLNFATPNETWVQLPSTASFVPSVTELAGTDPDAFMPTPAQVIAGVPAQERGLRPARALPYQFHVHGEVSVSNAVATLTFVNAGEAGACFTVRSAHSTDNVRSYTVEAGKAVSGSWSLATDYDLRVYGPNGFYRAYQGGTTARSAQIRVETAYGSSGYGVLHLTVTNTGSSMASVKVLDSYSGETMQKLLPPNQRLEMTSPRDDFYGWYDLIVTASEDATFTQRIAGHIETGRESYSDPALGGFMLVA